MKTLLFLISLFPSLLFGQNYVQAFEIQNPIADPLTNQQILLEFNTATLIAAGKMQPDCDDIRVADAPSGGNALSFWLESGCNETITRVWVKVPNIAGNATETVYLTYGEATAISASDGEATFLFFDDFSSGTIDPAKWNLLADATIDNSLGQSSPPSAKTNTNSISRNLESDVNIPAHDYAIHASFYDDGNTDGDYRAWIGTKGNGTGTGNNWAALAGIGFQTGTYWAADWGYTDTSPGQTYYESNASRTVGWHRVEVQRYECGFRYNIDQGVYEKEVFLGNSPAPSEGIMLYSYQLGNGYFDDIFVRKLISDGVSCLEPITTSLPEETIVNNSYVLPFDITNPISNAITDCQILLEFNSQDLILANKLQSDCDDIRILNAPTNGSALSFWLESGCNETITRVWVKVPNIAGNATETVYLTYGDATAISASDGEATFLFFDDFSSGTIDPAKWNLLSNAVIDNTLGQEAAPSAQAQVTNANDNNLRSNINLPTENFAFHASFYDNGFATGGNINTWIGVAPLSFLGIRNGTSPSYWYDDSFANTGIARTTGWHYGEIQIADCLERTILDHGAFDSGWFGTSGTPSYISLYSWNNNANFDNIFIRKIISDGTTCTDPVVVLGCEQSSGPGPGGVGVTDGSSNLKLWLKADEGVVTDGSNLVNEWQDQSGNCLHVSQSDINRKPTFLASAFNGAATLYFDGDLDLTQSDFLNNTTDNIMSTNSARTTFVVGQIDQCSDRGGTLLASRRTASVHRPMLYISPLDGVLYTYSDGTVDANNASIDISNFETSKKSFLFTQVADIPGTKITQRLNGTVLSVSQSGVVGGESGTTGFTVGLTEDAPQSPWFGGAWQGQIAEVIVYDRILTAQEIAAVESYLNAKYPSSTATSIKIPDTEPGSGYALSFDGTDDYIAMTNEFDMGTEDFTLECWIKTEAGSFRDGWTGTNDVGRSIFNKGLTLFGSPANAGYGLSLVSNGGNNELRFQVLGSTSTTATVAGLEEDKWYHVAAVREGTDIRIYVNGVLAASQSTGTVQDLNTNINFALGALVRLPANAQIGAYYKGKMDEARIWKTALTENTIRDYLCRKVTDLHPDICSLAAYFRMDNGVGGSVTDILNNENKTITGASWETSEAPLGDLSAWNYTGAASMATVNNPDGNGESAAASIAAGTADGIQLYYVGESPNSTAGATGYGSNDRYYGVHLINGNSATYDFIYDYAGNPYVNPSNESTLLLLKREHNADLDWESTSASLNLGAQTLTALGESTEYALGSSGNPLPIDLLYFTGEPVSSGNLLRWETSAEKDNAGFEILRAAEGRNWEVIGFQTGRGTSTERTNYQFMDQSPKRVNYYRLKQIDLDGKFSFSEIVQINFSTEPAIKVYPNPNYGNFNIEISTPLEKGNLHLSIVNHLGQIQAQKVIDAKASIHNYETPDLEGLYYLIIKSEGGHILWHKKVLFIR